MSFHYVPIVTSLAGGCLTAENWWSSGIKAVACSLQVLLTKPGEEALLALTSLKSYLGWSAGALILDARLPKIGLTGLYEWCSPYDGKKIQISPSDLLVLLKRLDYDAIILPKGSPSSLEEMAYAKAQVLKSDDDLSGEVRALLARAGAVLGSEQETEEEKAWVASPIAANVRPEAYECYWLTDLPAQHALSGKLYSEGMLLDVLEPSMAEQFKKIDEQCECATCELGLTRGYLHYLFQSTPLLCQRFLIQHNAQMFRVFMDGISTKLLQRL